MQISLRQGFPCARETNVTSVLKGGSSLKCCTQQWHQATGSLWNRGHWVTKHFARVKEPHSKYPGCSALQLTVIARATPICPLFAPPTKATEGLWTNIFFLTSGMGSIRFCQCPKIVALPHLGQMVLKYMTNAVLCL